MKAPRQLKVFSKHRKRPKKQCLHENTEKALFKEVQTGMKPIVAEEAQRGFIHHGAGEGGRHRLGPEGRGVGGGLSLKHKQTFFCAYSCLGRKKKRVTCVMPMVMPRV